MKNFKKWNDIIIIVVVVVVVIVIIIMGLKLFWSLNFTKNFFFVHFNFLFFLISLNFVKSFFNSLKTKIGIKKIFSQSFKD